MRFKIRFQVLGHKPNLRLEKNVLVIARNLADLQPANGASLPLRARVDDLPERLMRGSKQNHSAGKPLRLIVRFRLQARASNLLYNAWEIGDVQAPLDRPLWSG